MKRAAHLKHFIYNSQAKDSYTQSVPTQCDMWTKYFNEYVH